MVKTTIIGSTAISSKAVLDAAARRVPTPEETSSDVASSFDRSSDGQYEVIEYDFGQESASDFRHDPNENRADSFDAMDAAIFHSARQVQVPQLQLQGQPQHPQQQHSQQSSNDIFQDVGVSIEDDSPAAAALRANANVHVSSMGKAARAVHMQSVRRVLKHATGRTKGNKKGKPPRVPTFFDDDANSLVESEDGEKTCATTTATGSNSATTTTNAATVASNSATNSATAVGVQQTQEPLAAHPELLEEDSEDGEEDSATDAENLNNTTMDSEEEPLTPRKMDWDGVAPGTVEAGKKVLGTVDPHDLLKFVRWKRKKKGASKKHKSYVKGKVIDGEHELYTLSIAVMIGVRTSISRTNTELNSLDGGAKRWVRMADFRTTEKYEFRPKGDGPLPPHQLAHTFKFKDYCPVVFAYLRRMYGVNEFDFLLSVCGNANFIEFISNAKSGQFFFYSSDGRYMIKTMTNAESKFLRRILPQYFKHCCENPNTAITRFFGMYRVKLYHLRRNVKFVIMNSVYYTDKHLQTFYDLKGSSIGRDAKPGQAVLKDNDLRRSLEENALVLRPKQRAHVRSQMESDCEFLTEMDIMDYSMLVGVHHVPAFEGRVNGAATVSFRRSKLARSRKGTASSCDDSVSTDNSEGVVKLEHVFVDAVQSSRNLRSSLTGQQQHARTRSDERLAVPGHARTRSDTLGSTFAYEDGLEDDDNSYLMGSENRPGTNHSVNEETERKKQATVEKLFWPFHHLFDIHGHRRLKPALCLTCSGDPTCTCVDKDAKLLVGYKIPKFEAPLSDRKDGGLELDTTGLQLPMKMKGPSGEMMYEAKIFYMGVIDVLQEYNTRKAVESRYRWLQSPTNLAASCVPPKDYGQRFLEFFDEYTKRPEKSKKSDEEGVEISVRA